MTSYNTYHMANCVKIRDDLLASEGAESPCFQANQ